MFGSPPKFSRNRGLDGVGGMVGVGTVVAVGMGAAVGNIEPGVAAASPPQATTKSRGNIPIRATAYRKPLILHPYCRRPDMRLGPGPISGGWFHLIGSPSSGLKRASPVQYSLQQPAFVCYPTVVKGPFLLTNHTHYHEFVRYLPRETDATLGRFNGI